MITLVEIQKEYEHIMLNEQSGYERNLSLSRLMSLMEKEFKVPALRSEEWEKRNPKVIAMYRKISMSRDI